MHACHVTPFLVDISAMYSRMLACVSIEPYTPYRKQHNTIDVFHLHHKIGVLQRAAAIFGGRNGTCNIHKSESICHVFAPSQADSRNLSSLIAT